MESTVKEPVLKALDALKDLVASEKESSVKPASLEETQKFMPVLELKVGEKLRYKGGANMRFPKKDEEVYVYSTEFPRAKPDSNSTNIDRDDFSFLVIWDDGKMREFSADSRYFERVG